jgi:hypothetical protein
MKLSPKVKKALENMQPGEIAKTGFLGEDHRSLPDIIAHDEELCAIAGLDIQKAVEKMKYLSSEGEKGLGEPITVDSTWEVKISEARGRIPSPFEDALFKKRNTTIKNLNTGKGINFSDLSLYLIEQYHFFQGHGSTYRIEPQDLKAILEL